MFFKNDIYFLPNFANEKPQKISFICYTKQLQFKCSKFSVQIRYKHHLYILVWTWCIMHPSSNNCQRKQNPSKKKKKKNKVPGSLTDTENKTQQKKKKKRSGQCLETARTDRQTDRHVALIYKILFFLLVSLITKFVMCNIWVAKLSL